MRPIDADALIEFCAERWIPLNIDAVNMQPTIQPEKAQLSKEDTTSDTISRQAAIRWVKTECNPYGKPTLDFESGKKVIEHLKQMPSAQPEPKEGHWIGSDGSYICSECNGDPLDFIDTMGASCDAYVETLMKFCPNCGAKMTISTK